MGNLAFCMFEGYFCLLWASYFVSGQRVVDDGAQTVKTTAPFPRVGFANALAIYRNARLSDTLGEAEKNLRAPIGQEKGT